MKIATVLATIALALASPVARAALPAEVVALMDTTADPCDNFYQYSCGAWLKDSTIPPSQVSIDTSFTKVSDQAEAVIQQIVQDKFPYISEFWSSCMNTDQLDKLGSSPLDKQLGRIVWALDRPEVVHLGAHLARDGAGFLTDVAVDADLKNASMNVLYVGAASLVLPDVKYYGDNETMTVLEPPYKQYISTVMKLSGFDKGGKYYTPLSLEYLTEELPKWIQKQHSKPVLTLDVIASKIVALEKALAAIIPDTNANPDPMAWYNPITIAEAKRKYPLAFGKYSLGLGLMDKSTLKPTSTIVFDYLDYFDKLEDLIKKTPLLDLKLYLAFSYINKNSRFLSDAYYEAFFQFFSKTINGQQKRSERNRICVYRETDYLPDLIGNYYFNKMFDKVREDNAKLMVTLIEAAMHDHIVKLDWLDDATRAAAEAKLKKVANLIGHSTLPIEFPFKLKNDAYFDNIHKISLFNFEVAMKKAGQPVNRQKWDMSAAEVNAYYSPLENKIVFPAAILQPPFFNGTSHPAQNFGAIGAIVGHELTHGFDSSGRLFDGDGNVRNWWTPQTAAEFDKRAQCMKDEYSAIEVIGEDGKPLAKVNGATTITENIADNGGVSLSWDAYHAFIKSASNVPTNGVLPGEDDKLFFVSFAQVWCSKYRDGAILQQLQTDPHSPGIARTNGVVMNSDHFAKTFQCKAGSKMNPEKKCLLW